MDDRQLSAKFPELTDAELAAYKMKRAQLFKGTIAVCVVYGVIALSILLFMWFSATGRAALVIDFSPFMVTFVVGMVVVIATLATAVASFKPQVHRSALYDTPTCPDYWTIRKTPADAKALVNAGTDKHLMQYQCMPSSRVYDLSMGMTATGMKPYDIDTKIPVTNAFGHTWNGAAATVPLPPAPADRADRELKTAAATMYDADGHSGKLRCDLVYPQLLARDDATKFPEAPNTLRCRYAKTCKIPWTSACPT